MNSYQKEVTTLKIKRDNAILGQVDLIFQGIQDKSKKMAMEVTTKAGDNTSYFQERNRAELFAKEVNEELRPSYLANDAFIKKTYEQEYTTAYIQSLYSVVNEGIDSNYLLKLPKYTEKQFAKAIKYPLSKLVNTTALKSARDISLNQIYNNIVSGVEQGSSLASINNTIDKTLGYRDSVTGKKIVNKKLYKGQQYKTMRILRTEILRMRATAETDQWINQQPIVESQLQLVETLDDKTRSQSANMDGQIANKEGKFQFPNGQYSYAHQSGVAKWDINDRSTTITLDPLYKPTQRIQRDKDGNNIIKPYQDFKQYAKDNNMTVNKYGQVLFPK